MTLQWKFEWELNSFIAWYPNIFIESKLVDRHIYSSQTKHLRVGIAIPENWEFV